MARTTRAGTPATIVSAATSLVTTAPAPTIGAVADGHAGDDGHAGTEPDVATDHDRATGSCLLAGPGRCRWLSVVSVLPWPMRVPSPMVMPPVSWKRHPMLMKTSLPRRQVLAELAVEGREHGDRRVHGPAGESAQQGAHLVGRAVSGVELGGDPQRLLRGVVHEPVLLASRPRSAHRCSTWSRKSCSSIALTGPRRSR